MGRRVQEWKDQVDLSQTCSCNDDGFGDNHGLQVKPCDSDCGGCGFICACQCCKPRQRAIYGGLATGAVVLAVAIGLVVYYIVTHHVAALKKVRDYVSNKLWGPRKLRFIPRSELDAPKSTHITEEMDIDPYSAFPSKDLTDSGSKWNLNIAIAAVSRR
ncbi:leucine-rich repeats and immunoglobulin-like domains 1-like protein [Babesia ovata]|uniref:Leucine-rich repeats and immunoglobulin-like domains 1-like protein n=1 Tax=Babesia ovata TaxID=189622 RepID=A0A2H6K804_9APIC|nr:leucine-rich repeats and immunoglobulin-like domains 1-like protein [Babesia ovata]GBE59126.1 leucine-rich repeats and immunoglobulin-like domains 1-like protein [Babesia ovata]